MRSQSKALIISAIVILAIVTFIYVQNKSTLSSHTQSQNPKQKKSVLIAYQTGVDPAKVAQANGDYEKDSEHPIQWKKFDTGSDVVNALASGDVDIGNIGSSPLAAAASRDLPIDVFLIASKLGRTEALVVSQHSGIEKPADLNGKTIAVPFVSTAHYSLLSALKHWGLDDSKLKVINLRPPEIAAAWQRGDIDATYVWEPALSQVIATGKVLTDSQQVAEWGAPTFDVWVVRKEFAEKNPEFLKSFVNVSLKRIDEYLKDPQAFSSNPDYLNQIAQLTGSNAKDIPLLLSGNIYLNRTQQRQIFETVFAKNILDTATFLKSQGKVDQVKADYQNHVNAVFLKAEGE